MKDPEDTDMHNTYYIQHYANEQDINIIGMCNKASSPSVKCFIGYATSVSAFKAMVVLPSQTTKIAPYDAMMRGTIALVPSMKFFQELIKTEGVGIPGMPSNVRYLYKQMGLGLEVSTTHSAWHKFPACLVFFDSFEHLVQLMQTLTSDDIIRKKRECQVFAKKHRAKVLKLWREAYGIAYVTMRGEKR